LATDIKVNQALIDEIVSGVLAKLQRIPVRPVTEVSRPQTVTIAPAKPMTPPSWIEVPTAAQPQPLVVPASSAGALVVVELSGPVITADLLEQSIRAGQSLRIGRNSILTPSARDWLNSRRTAWTRQDKVGSVNGGPRAKWQLILQTVTPTVRSLHEGLRRMSDGWKIELVGQPLEAVKLATNLINTAESDGVVIFTEQADLIACQANRNERVRAAVMQDSKQWEHVTRTLSANVVCISPIGRTFIELRNLLRDCSGSRPQLPAGM
jgi:hypothetical protein